MAERKRRTGKNSEGRQPGPQHQDKTVTTFSRGLSEPWDISVKLGGVAELGEGARTSGEGPEFVHPMTIFLFLRVIGREKMHVRKRERETRA